MGILGLGGLEQSKWVKNMNHSSEQIASAGLCKLEGVKLSLDKARSPDLALMVGAQCYIQISLPSYLSQYDTNVVGY